MSVGAASTAARIPEVHTPSLSNEQVSLPEGLRGKPGVLVIGFSQSSRDAVTAWGRRLAADYRDSPSVLYYEMPVLASVPRLVRGLVIRQIKASVPERAQPRFVPLLDKEQEWRSAAHFDKANEAYVLLVDGKGLIQWQTEGGPTDRQYAELKEQLTLAEKKSAL